MNAPSYRQISVLFIPVIVGSVLILYATSAYGVGVSRDSVAYLNAARNFASQGAFVTDITPGPSQPLTHFPVFYPAVLSILYRFPAEAVVSARWLNVILFSLYVLGIETLALRAAGGSFVTAVASGLFAALSYDVLYVFAFAWSETLFLALFVWGMFFLGEYLMRGRMRPLLWAAVLCALAWLTRYVGVTLLATGGVAILLWSHRSMRRRLGDAALFSIVAAAPMIALLLRNYLLTNSVANRSLAVHPPPVEWWYEGAGTMGGWIVPLSAPASVVALAALAIVVLSGIGGYLVVQARRRSPYADEAARAWVYPALLLLFSAVYLATFWAVVSFADTGSLSGRTLSPVFAALLVVAAYVAQTFVGRLPDRGRLVWVGLGFALLALAFQAQRSAKWTLAAHDLGLHYNTAAYRTSPAVDRVDLFPLDYVLYSNNPPLLYFLSGRRSYALDAAPCRDSCEEMAGAWQQAGARSAGDWAVVWAAKHDPGECGPCLDALGSTLGFEPAARDDLLTVYVSEGPL